VIALVDYGAGNLTSVRKALAAIGAEAWTPSEPGELARANGIIVPGVGHFDATRGLTADWRAAIESFVHTGTPLLGICVGLQWLFEGSVEAPNVAGLGVFPGVCQWLGTKPEEPGRDGVRPLAVNRGGVRPLDMRNPARGQTPMALKVPHVGWNDLAMPRPSRLMAGIAPGTQVYFTHSYAAPVNDDSAAICEYGVPFSAAVERDNVAAVQFHPEKSGPAGLHVLGNWLRGC
jgi:glutamine amidotransferase